MLKSKEIVSVLLCVIVFTFVIIFRKTLTSTLTSQYLLTALIISLLILSLSVFAKKLTAFYLDSETNEKILEWYRYGYYEKSHFSHPLPAGIIFPFVLSALSLGYFFVLTFLQFEPSPLLSRVSKSKGLYRYSEMTETHIGLIASSGIAILLLTSILGYLLPFQAANEFSKFAVYYAFWNMLPLGNLDGAKIFFGSRVIWSILMVLSFIGLGYALLLI
jgi:hypothetical protein